MRASALLAAPLLAASLAASLGAPLVACGEAAPRASAPPASAGEGAPEARDRGEAAAEVDPAGEAEAAEPAEASVEDALAALGAPPSASCAPSSTEGLAMPARSGTDAVAFVRTRRSRGPEGYTQGEQHLVELRDIATLSARWRRASPEPITALAASEDGAWIAVGTHTSVTVLSAADGSVRARIPLPAHQLAFGPGGRLARGAGAEVSEHAPPNFEATRSHTLTGTAPTVIHAMMEDGECEEILGERDTVHVAALAYDPAGHLFAGASDGSVRALGGSARYTLPDAESGRGYAIQPLGLAPGGPGELISVWGGGTIVTLDARTLRPRRSIPGACSAAERARFTPDLLQRCEEGRGVAIDAGRVAVGARVRELGGRSRMSAPSLHGSGALLNGEELWLFGHGSAERWRLDGRFQGYLPIEGRPGWIRDLSPTGRYLALTGATEPVAFERVNADTHTLLHLWDTERGVEIGAGSPGVRARFLSDARVAVQRSRPARIELLELPSARVERRLPLGDFEYAGLIEADASRLVLATAAGRGEVLAIGAQEADDRRIALDFGAGVLTKARLRGDLVAVVVFEARERAAPTRRVELFRLEGASARRIARVENVLDAIELDARGLVYLPLAAPRPTLLDPQTGRSASFELPAAPAATNAAEAPLRWIGRAGELWVTWTQGAGHPLLHAGRPFGPPLLSVERIARAGDRTLLYGLDGRVYLVDGEGRTLASVAALDGAYAIRSAAGHVAAPAAAQPAFLRAEGESLRSCEASSFSEDLLRRLLRRAPIDNQ